MTAGPRLTAAGLQRLGRELSPRDWAVLRDVARCRLMSGRSSSVFMSVTTKPPPGPPAGC